MFQVRASLDQICQSVVRQRNIAQLARDQLDQPRVRWGKAGSQLHFALGKSNDALVVDVGAARHVESLKVPALAQLLAEVLVESRAVTTGNF